MPRKKGPLKHSYKRGSPSPTTERGQLFRFNFGDGQFNRKRRLIYPQNNAKKKRRRFTTYIMKGPSSSWGGSGTHLIMGKGNQLEKERRKRPPGLFFFWNFFFNKGFLFRWFFGGNSPERGAPLLAGKPHRREGGPPGGFLESVFCPGGPGDRVILKAKKGNKLAGGPPPLLPWKVPHIGKKGVEKKKKFHTHKNGGPNENPWGGFAKGKNHLAGSNTHGKKRGESRSLGLGGFFFKTAEKSPAPGQRGGAKVPHTPRRFGARQQESPSKKIEIIPIVWVFPFGIFPERSFEEKKRAGPFLKKVI